MQVRLLFFATLKDIVGARQMQLELPAGATVADVLTQLEVAYPRMRDYRPVILAAINEEIILPSWPVPVQRRSTTSGQKRQTTDR